MGYANVELPSHSQSVVSLRNLYPSWQSQLYEPSVLTQSLFSSQDPGHSSMSVISQEHSPLAGHTNKIASEVSATISIQIGLTPNSTIL